MDKIAFKDISELNLPARILPWMEKYTVRARKVEGIFCDDIIPPLVNQCSSVVATPVSHSRLLRLLLHTNI
jgi:hypothetical protein